jgi:hypothetical protein
MTRLSGILTAAGLAAAFGWGGVTALLVAALLAVMEVSLSFDNAVVNAAVLRRMDPVWQQRFLTWGVLIAVFGVRLVFPVVVVAVATGLSAFDVARMALADPAAYGRHLAAAHLGIASFGGIFLLLVFLHFVFDEKKDVYWLGWVERRLARAGRLHAAEVSVALWVLLILQLALPADDRLTSTTAGVLGAVCFSTVKGIADAAGRAGGDSVVRSGATGFVYLEVLDASFSLDGVIGAFAITTDIVVILIGLGIGALFVRTFTIRLVRRGTLEGFVYLEHGAHWGIGVLGIVMLVSTRIQVPELVGGLVGATFTGLALVSSVRQRRTRAVLMTSAPPGPPETNSADTV